MQDREVKLMDGSNLMDLSTMNSCQRLFLSIPLQNQDLSWFMRATLTDWMREAGKDLGLRRKTVHNSISLLDRYLMFSTNFTRCRLQLLGVTCLFIASKIEEVEAPTMKNFSYMTTNSFSCDEIKLMEIEICKKVGWLLLTGPYSVGLPSNINDTPEPILFIKKAKAEVKELSIEEKEIVAYSFKRGNLNTILGAMTEEWDFWLSQEITSSESGDLI